MRVIPANQSLILASESARPQRAPGADAGASSFELGDALRVVTNGAVLNRVTIVAGRPEANVVLLQADYSSSTSVSSFGSAPAAPTIISYDAQATGVAALDAAGPHDTGGGRAAKISSNPSPVEQYVRTQRSLGNTSAAALLDVYA